jgi:hypothetical protein
MTAGLIRLPRRLSDWYDMPMTLGESPSWPRRWRNLALLLLLLGVAWRGLRFSLQFPIWGDEAFVCLNFLDRDYLGLTRPLRFVQVAPILFLWSELTVFRLLGGSELALRLLPILAGLGSLFLFWRLVRMTLSPAAGVLAVGFLAVAYYPVRHSCEVKPYAFDLFFALALWVAAVSWQRQPERLRWLAVLVLLLPFALGLSYPAVFVAGAVSVALLPAVCRLRDTKTWLLYSAYNALMLASFFGLYLIAGTSQYNSTGGAQNSYWADWFPPAEPVAFLKWLAQAHTGNMMAYPAGGRHGASTVTFLLSIAGLWHLSRHRRWDLLLLLLAPFALTFAAAALHRYPYGGSARVTQHFAPAICLLAGTGAAIGLAGVTRWIGDEWRWSLVACGILAAIGLVGMARDWGRPYKTDGDRMVRQIVNEIAQKAGPNDQIVVLDVATYICPPFEWYLRRQGDRVHWNGEVDWEHLQNGGGLWGLSFSRDGSARTTFESQLSRNAWFALPIEHQQYDLQLGQGEETLEHCEVFYWKSLLGRYSGNRVKITSPSFQMMNNTRSNP